MGQQATNKGIVSQIRLDLRKFIIKWNNDYPIDFIWRKKYGVAFGSQEHRQMSFLDMLFDLEEEKMMNNYISKRIENKENKLSKNNILSDDEFDNIDINQFNAKKQD